MLRQVDPEQLFLPGKHLLSRRIALLVARTGDEHRVQLRAETEIGEKAALTALPIALFSLGGLQNGVETIQLPHARTELVARSALDKGFENALVGALQIDPAAKIVER